VVKERFEESGSGRRDVECDPRTAQPATMRASPAITKRACITDIPHQRRSTFTRSSDESDQFLAQFFVVKIEFAQIAREIREGAEADWRSSRRTSVGEPARSLLVTWNWRKN
jgi:zona occludens toxin (predicted ATPase)